jgi:hypothetical protein
MLATHSCHWNELYSPLKAAGRQEIFFAMLHRDMPSGTILEQHSQE